MSLIATGTLNKMRASLDGAVSYRLPVGDEEIDLSPFLGQTLTLTHTGNIFAVHAGRKPRRAILKATVSCV